MKKICLVCGKIITKKLINKNNKNLCSNCVDVMEAEILESEVLKK